MALAKKKGWCVVNHSENLSFGIVFCVAPAAENCTKGYGSILVDKDRARLHEQRERE